MLNKLKEKITARQILLTLIFINAFSQGMTYFISFDNSYIFYINCVLTLVIYIYEILNKKISIFSKENALFVLIILSLLLSNILNIEYSSSNSFVKVAYMGISFFGLAIFDRNDKKYDFFNLLFKLIISFTFVMSFISLVLYIMEINNCIFFNSMINNGRFSGTYNNPNIIAIWAYLSIMISFIYYNISKYNILLMINIIIQIICLLLSNARGPLLILIISILLLINYKYKFKRKTKFVFIISVVLILSFGGYLFIKLNIRPETTLFFNLAINSLKNGDLYEFYMNINRMSGYRLFLWEGALYAMLQKPLFGVGLNNLRTAIGAMFGNRYPIYTELLAEDPHNSIFSLLGYTGLIGTGLFVYLLASYFRKINKIVKDNICLYILYIIQIALLIFSLFDIGVFFDLRIQGIMFWYIMGIINYIADKKEGMM